MEQFVYLVHASQLKPYQRQIVRHKDAVELIKRRVIFDAKYGFYPVWHFVLIPLYRKD